MKDRAQQIGLFRYSLVRPAADPALSHRERGALVRELASRYHLGPDGDQLRISRNTLDRWIRSLRAGGFEALVPVPRHVETRTSQRLLELAESLRLEEPARTAAQIARLIAESEGHSPSARTIQRHLAREGLLWKGAESRVFGRFEAEGRNELWTGDALHGPVVSGHKSYLFAFIDDWSRLLTGYRFGHAEDTLRLEAALRFGIASRGLPAKVYLDNGSAMVSRQLLRACARLGIVLVHSRPGKPQGRGKIERVFRTVREQFLVEVPHAGVTSLEQLNSLFSAWVESVYHKAVHSETGEAPLDRFFSAGPPALVDPARLGAAFRWSETRRVDKNTATVSLFGNCYEVDAALAGQRIELVFDPFELGEAEVVFNGRPMGNATPQHISRHVHPAARHEPAERPPRPSGIDYLGLVEARRSRELASRIDYRHLGPGEPASSKEGQL